MTLPVADPVRIAIPGDDWPAPFVLPERCMHPTCGGRGTQRHHCVRRSATGGPVDFVTIDSIVVANVVRLCDFHHDQLTGLVGGHRAALRIPTFEAVEAGIHRRWWVWYSAMPAPPLPGLPVLPLKSGRALYPLDYVDEVMYA